MGDRLAWRMYEPKKLETLAAELVARRVDKDGVAWAVLKLRPHLPRSLLATVTALVPLGPHEKALLQVRAEGFELCRGFCFLWRCYWQQHYFPKPNMDIASPGTVWPGEEAFRRKCVDGVPLVTEEEERVMLMANIFARDFPRRPEH